MHERTQRAVARLLFVFCCAVPTTIVLASILITWTPWYQSKTLARITYNLARETGLEFQIERCRLIAPGKYVLDNVRIADPDTGLPIATIRMIDYFQGKDRVGIVLHQPEIRSSGLAALWASLHDRLIRSRGQTMLPIKIVATDLNIQSRTGSLPLRDLSAEIMPEGNSVRMLVRAGDPSSRTEPQIRVDLFRDREGAVPATELVLSTVGTALPCSALAEYVPAIASLGPDAEFTGTIKCNESLEGWSFDLGSSSVTKMNLSYLTDALPHRVLGDADIHLRRCLIQPGQVVDINGTIEARGIRIKPALLAAMHERLGIAVDFQEASEHPNGLEYKLAAIQFEITDETMKLQGICDRFLTGIGSDVALYARGRAIAITRPQRFDTDEITAILQPPSRILATWNQVLLPSAPTAVIADRPRAEIRRVTNSTGRETIRQE